MNDSERSALAAYRTSLGERLPEPGRDWSRLVGKIEAGAQPLSVELEPPPRRRWLAWGVGAAAAVVLALWAWPRFEATQGEDSAGSSQAAYGAEEPAPSVLARPQPEPPRPTRTEPRPSTPEDPAPATQDDVRPDLVLDEAPKHAAEPAGSTKQPTRSGTGAKPVAEVSKTEDVVAEAQALREIRASLRDQHAGDALRLLRRHLARFPSGVLRDEATVLRADALCMDGQREKARGVASGFVRTHPKSPLTARARGVCREP